MNYFDIKLTATIVYIVQYNLREPDQTVDIESAASGLQSLLTSGERILSPSSYNFLTHKKITYYTGIKDPQLLDQILAIWCDVPATKTPSPSPESNAFNFYEALTKLLPSQFEMLEFLLEIPNEKRAPNTLQLSDRVVHLLRYLNKQAGGLNKLEAELTKSYPHLLTR